MAYDPPKVGLQKIFPKTTNFVRFAFANECDLTWWIYIETFIPSFIKLVFTVTVPDLNDIVRGRGEAISAEGRAGSRKRGGKFRRAPAFVADKPSERYASKGTQFLLRLTDPLEKIGFRFLLYGATEQFFADWQTLIQRSGACGKLPDAGPLTRRSSGHQQGLLPTGADIPLPILDVNRGNWATTSFGAGLPDGKFMVTVSIECLGPKGDVQGVRIGLVNNIFGIPTVLEGPPTELKDGVKGSVMANFFFTVLPFTTGGIAWVLMGPAVPVGLACEKAFASVSRVDSGL